MLVLLPEASIIMKGIKKKIKSKTDGKDKKQILRNYVFQQIGGLGAR